MNMALHIQHLKTESNNMITRLCGKLLHFKIFEVTSLLFGKILTFLLPPLLLASAISEGDLSKFSSA